MFFRDEVYISCVGYCSESCTLEKSYFSIKLIKYIYAIKNTIRKKIYIQDMLFSVLMFPEYYSRDQDCPSLIFALCVAIVEIPLKYIL